MNKKTVIAYAITHAPRGVKGGPYEPDSEEESTPKTPRLSDALRWLPGEANRERATYFADGVGGRVIRIVRAHRLCDACGFLVEAERRRRAPAPSAVEVLRELVAIDDALNEGRDPPCTRLVIAARARHVLAVSGPDPMPVVRAALRFAEHCTPALEGAAWFEATCKFIHAVDAYRKAGGTP